VSLLGGLKDIAKGAIGFASGGPLGAVAAIQKNRGPKAQMQPQVVQLASSLMPTVGSTVGQYSASPSTRLASLPGMSLAPSTGGAGATGSWAPSGRMRYSHNVVDATTGRVYRVSNKTGKIIRPRRMNPLNGHAARRAIRRIKGARKMLQAIERSLPKARTHRAPARGR
jgi:hypothetical protein